MLLGKRPRPPMIRRTTSMTGITVDLNPSIDTSAPEPSDHKNDSTAAQNHQTTIITDLHATTMTTANIGLYGYDERFLATMVSPRNHRRSGGEFVETAHFLRTCGLCKRSLASGRDIYMYRGDTAFCSLECREQKMKQDERKEKCNVMTSKKNEDHHHHHGRHVSPSTKTSSKAAVA